MILYYAVGGGLGHLTRARALLHTLGIQEPATILCSSPFGADPRIAGPHEIKIIPHSLMDNRKAYTLWFRKWLAEQNPSALYVDAFPSGILGELCGIAFPRSIRLIHVARFLRWQEYQQVLTGDLPPFERTLRVEPLDADQSRVLQQQGGENLNLSLADPPAFLDSNTERIIQAQRKKQEALWLIVHSGAVTEVQDLIDYAKEMSQLESVAPRLLLVAPQQVNDCPSSILQMDLYPATMLFPIADRIISACGFNIMRQTESCEEKHRFIPFPRRFDNQFLRAARRRHPSG
jgi:hypothetical protein